MDPNEARRLIEEHIAYQGPHSHNMVGLILAELAETYGPHVADQLIDDLGLYDLFGIAPEDGE